MNERYFEGALQSEADKLVGTADGHRNGQLNITVFSLGTMRDFPGFDAEKIERETFKAAEANGYVKEHGPAAARRTIRRSLEEGMRNPRPVPNGKDWTPPSRPRRAVARLSAADPQGEDPDVPIPDWTEPGEDGKPFFKDVGKTEPAPIKGEIRRHLYRRDGNVVRVKIKYQTSDGARWTNAYLVRRPSDGATGWQAKKPEGFVAGPYIGAVNPFDPEMADDPALCTEGEKDTDTLARHGLPAFTFGGTSDLPAGCEELVRGRDVVVLADNDSAGCEHAEKKAALFATTAQRVRVLHFPETPERGDVSDWFENHGGTVEALWERTEQAPTWAPGPEPGDKAGASEDHLQPIFDPWEDYIVPAFPLDILPPGVERFVIEESRGIGCDPSALAMSVMAAASGALSHKFRLNLMRHKRWWVSPRLWVLLVGPPSRKKTPVIKHALKEIEELQSAAYKKYREALDEYQAAREAFDKKDKNTELPEPKPPTRPRRYVISDITVEKLGEILARSPRGLMVKRDELAGWIASMEKYGGKGGGGSDRAFWLQAYDGGPYTVDRISRGELHIENLSVSILGGIQPERLAEMHGLTSDGLLQRFLPVMMGPSTLPIDEPGYQENDQFDTFIRKLIRAEPASLIMSDEALPVFKDIQEHIDKLEKVGDAYARGFEGFLGKLPGVAGNLTLILHLIPDPDENRLHPVSRKTAEDARRLVLDFILPHAFEFYRSSEKAANDDHLRRLASWILTSGKESVNSRDLVRNVRDLRGASTKDIQTRLSPLIAGGWLEPKTPGPDCRVWTVTPAVAHQLEHRRQVEEDRKAAGASLMGALRRPQ